MRVAAPQVMMAAKRCKGGFPMNILARFRLGPIWRRWGLGLGLGLGLGMAGSLATPVSAQTMVDLQLALMVDASGSVNQYRFLLQKRGYVEALRNPKILAAILGGRSQSIAI